MEPRVNPMGQSNWKLKAVMAIYRFKAQFLITFTAVMSLVILYALLAPREYQSEMNIPIRNMRPSYQITSERANETSVQPDVTEERINSEIEILRSRDVADKVLDPTWNTSGTKGRSNLEISTHEKAVEAFSKHLNIEYVRKLNGIHVIYTAKSPSIATGTLTRLLDVFLAKQHELEESRGALNFFAEEQKRYKRELELAQQQLANYQQDRHIVSLSNKEADLEHQIIELQQQLRATDVQISEYSDRLASGQRELQSLAQRQTTQQKTIPNILATEQLSTMLAGYRNQKTSLLTKYQPTDRLVQEVDQQIVNTSEALRTASEIQPSEKTTDINPVWQQVKSVMSQNSIDLNAAMARRRDQASQLTNLEASLVSTERLTVDFNTLQTKVSESQGNYQLYTQKRNEAQIADAIGQQQMSNVTTVERPTFSAISSNPRLGLTFSVGLFAAFFIALCNVFLFETVRGTIASVSELEAITIIPVLAAIPFIGTDYFHYKRPSSLVAVNPVDNSHNRDRVIIPRTHSSPAARFKPAEVLNVLAKIATLNPMNKSSITLTRTSLIFKMAESRSP